LISFFIKYQGFFILFDNLKKAGKIEGMNRTVKLGKNYCIKKSDLLTLHNIQKTHSDAERKFQQDALKAGWEIFRAGWPDYLIIKGKKYSFVEVKGRGDCLNLKQKLMLNTLLGLGLKCYTWRPDSGFKLYKKEKV
jgi:hypothetical protein